MVSWRLDSEGPVPPSDLPCAFAITARERTLRGARSEVLRHVGGERPIHFMPNTVTSARPRPTPAVSYQNSTLPRLRLPTTQFPTGFRFEGNLDFGVACQASRQQRRQRCGRHAGRTLDYLVLPARTTRAMRRARVLLVPDAAVGRAQQHEPCRFRGVQERAILLSVSQLLGLRRVDCVPGTQRPPASPFGVPWLKRMSTVGTGPARSALRHKLEHGQHLVARTSNCSMTSSMLQILEVLDHRGHGQARALEHPGAAHLARHALDGWTLGPVVAMPWSGTVLPPDYGKLGRPSRGFTPRLASSLEASTDRRWTSASNWRDAGSRRVERGLQRADSSHACATPASA